MSRATAPFAQVSLPSADGAPSLALVGTAPHIGVPSPVGVPRLLTEVSVAVAAHDGGTAAARRRDVPDVPVSFEGVAGGRGKGRRVVPIGGDNPLPLRAAAEGEAGAQVRACTRGAATGR